MIEPLYQSFIWVTTGANFWAYTSTILIIGIYLGWRQNKGMTGFKRSMYVLMPLALIYFFTSANRVWEYSQQFGYGAQSFNNLVSLVLITLTYTLGLFAGHMVKHKSIESAVKEAGVPKKDQKQVIKQIAESM